jgi:hypothetical protein
MPARPPFASPRAREFGDRRAGFALLCSGVILEVTRDGASQPDVRGPEADPVRGLNDRFDNFLHGAHQEEHADLRARVARLEAKDG